MIRRYTHPAMGRIWSDERRFDYWLEVELAAAEAMAEAGIVPADAVRELVAKASFDIARIDEISRPHNTTSSPSPPRSPNGWVRRPAGCTSA